MGDKEKRTVRYSFKATPEEKRIIQQKMKLAGVKNQSAFIRKMTLNGYLLKLDLPELRETVRLMGSLSNNVNQIAKRVNSTGRIYTEDLDGIRQSLDSLWNEANGILRKLAAIS